MCSIIDMTGNQSPDQVSGIFLFFFGGGGVGLGDCIVIEINRRNFVYGEVIAKQCTATTFSTNWE